MSYKAILCKISVPVSHYANTMMAKLGHTPHFAVGSDKNTIFAAKDDLEMFKVHLKRGRTVD